MIKRLMSFSWRTSLNSILVENREYTDTTIRTINALMESLNVVTGQGFKSHVQAEFL